MIQIERLRTMARDAIEEYQSALVAGGEPTFPQWAEDLLAVCDHAEVGLQFRSVARTTVTPERRRNWPSLMRAS
ncbi:hypothetical protein [Massilia niabensis]|uniref:Uncharacterized protein n=1 Tax=Massilia niabensis TaxID=544910 RepID=A0ABW0L9R1_9BURK